MNFNAKDFGVSEANTLTQETIAVLDGGAKWCRHMIVDMVKHSQSGHPGGSLSLLDALLAVTALEVAQTHDPIVISNGHCSPAGYAVLAAMGLHERDEIVQTFRQFGSKFEGHVTRHVRGIDFGTGPLGVGVSAAAGMAKAEQIKGTQKRVWGFMGDGEFQEGQVHEVLLFGAKNNLNNLCIVVDYNAVQLTDSLENIMPTDVAGISRAHGWNVIECDGHDWQALADAIAAAKAEMTKPTMIVAQTIMGHGVPGMEEEGRAHKSTWHGNAPKPNQADAMMAAIGIGASEQSAIEVLQSLGWNPPAHEYPVMHSHNTAVQTGTPQTYGTEVLTDCRSAYGTALADLAAANQHVVGMTADLMKSVKTDKLAGQFPDRHIECGICEQHMVSAAGGLAVRSLVPFCSTFGAFMSSRAKDQARVNDINECNVKMVATHCGLSVGEDGPTHQAIDDMGSFMGLLNTAVLEPADPNQCDRMVRWAASHWGPVYIRMGRHKLPALTDASGDLLFGGAYEYSYGACTRLREGDAITIIASGASVHEALTAVTESGVNAEIIIVTSPKQFDETLRTSLLKTRRYLTVEDHTPYNGFGAAVNSFVVQGGIAATCAGNLGVREYQLSGKPAELYASAKIGPDAIKEILKSL